MLAYPLKVFLKEFPSMIQSSGEPANGVMLVGGTAFGEEERNVFTCHFYSILPVQSSLEI